MGEAAIDTGGPSREFFRLTIATGVEAEYCRCDENGCFLNKNVSALQVSA